MKDKRPHQNKSRGIADAASRLSIISILTPLVKGLLAQMIHNALPIIFNFLKTVESASNETLVPFITHLPTFSLCIEARRACIPVDKARLRGKPGLPAGWKGRSN